MNSPAIYYICLLYMSSASAVSSPVAAVSETAGFRFRRGHHENFRAGSLAAACLRQALTTPILLFVTIWAASHLNPALSDEGGYRTSYLASRSSSLMGTSQWASRISKRCCSSRL